MRCSVGDLVTIRSWKRLVNEFGLKAQVVPFDDGWQLNTDLYFPEFIGNEICEQDLIIECSYPEGYFRVGGWLVGAWGFNELHTHQEGR